MNKLFEKWHKTAPFGMFIHWGLYSIPEYHEQDLMRQKQGREPYEALINSFNPTEYNPEEWVLMAKNAGMKYICITTKHHDGFCMWDTKMTDYNIMNTPYKKDVLKMLQLACEKHGMKLSLYYSIPDWHQKNAYNYRSSHQIEPRETDEPDIEKYIDFIKGQVRELLTNYGEISTFFWDIKPRYEDPSVNALLRELQPNILINDRGFDAGDFSTPERFIPEGSIFTSPTEACESIGRQAWSFRKNEDYSSCNSLKQGIDKITAMGGNFLLNVGPKAHGEISQKAKDMIGEVGRWYNIVKESFVDAEPVVLFDNKDEILTTINGCNLYLHFPTGLNYEGIVLDPITEMPESVVLLNDNSKPTTELVMIPTFHKREDWDVKYLHIYDMPCDKLGNEPVVVKFTFSDDCDIQEFFNKELSSEESRF